MGKIKSLLHVIIVFTFLELVDSFCVVASTYIYLKSDSFALGQIVHICLNTFCVVFAVYMYGKFVLKKSFSDMYMGKKQPSLKWCAVAVLVPVAVAAFYIIFTKGTFYRGSLSWNEQIYTIFSAIFGYGFMAALTEGMLFQGVMLSCLQKAWGAKGAFFLSSLLIAIFGLNHRYPESTIEVFIWFFAFLLLEMALSLVVYESGSVWSAVVVYAVHNILSRKESILHIDLEQDSSAILNYTFESDNWLLTGIPGVVGIPETDFPTLLGFMAIIFLAVYFIRKRGTGILYAGDSRKE